MRATRRFGRGYTGVAHDGGVLSELFAAGIGYCAKAYRRGNAGASFALCGQEQCGNR